MVDRNDIPTADGSDDEHETNSPIGRRRMLQLVGVGLAGGAVASSAGAADDSVRLEIVAAADAVDYSFTATGAIERISDGGFTAAESSDEVTQNADGTWTATGRAEAGYGDAFSVAGDVIDFQPADGAYRLYVDGERRSRDDLVVERTTTKRLEITTPADGSVTYEFTTTGEITKVLDNGDRSAEDNDEVVQNADGTWTAAGLTGNGYGDTFTFEGEVVSFSPMEGDFGLLLDGQEVTADELTGGDQQDDTQSADRENWYAYEGSGDTWSDYYLEVEDGGDLLATTRDGAVVESDFHWISEDGTKAAGRVDPGERHVYEFDGGVLDSTVEGEADAYVNGNSSDLSWYPRPGATGDSWKGGFPWQESDDEQQDDTQSAERENWYAYEGAGESWSDYYLEVEDGGDLLATTRDGAVVEDEFHWISEDGTKAAGRVDPGERHVYEFDGGVLDSTVEGEADAYVNGSPSDLSWYPQPGATGDEWKGGFPWQDEEETTISDGPSIGGGPGYANTVTRAEADVVVTGRSALRDALSSASSGDVVFVPGSASIDLASGEFHVPDGVTVASNRGVDGGDGAMLYTDEEAEECFILHGDARLTGVQLKGPHPGDDWSGSSGAGAVAIRGASEVDNCDVWGFSHHGIRPDQGDGAHIHHNVVREINKSGLGYGIGAASGTPVIEYNYFNYNRHSIATSGENPGYVLRYNHFGPKEVMHNIDAHPPAGRRYEIHNNVVETIRREWDDNLNHAVDIRGVPDDVATITDNWFFNDNAPDPNGAPDQGGQTIVQEDVSEWTNVSFSANYYGEGAATYSDVIPGYDGWRSP